MKLLEEKPHKLEIHWIEPWASYMQNTYSTTELLPFGAGGAIHPFGLLARERAASKASGLPRRSVSLFSTALWDRRKALIKPERRQGSKGTDGD